MVVNTAKSRPAAHQRLPLGASLRSKLDTRSTLDKSSIFTETKEPLDTHYRTHTDGDGDTGSVDGVEYDSETDSITDEEQHAINQKLTRADLTAILREQQRLVHANNALHRASIEREEQWESYRAKHCNEVQRLSDETERLRFLLESKNVSQELIQSLTTAHTYAGTDSGNDSGLSSARIAGLEAGIALRDAEIDRLSSLVEHQSQHYKSLVLANTVKDLVSDKRRLESQIEFLTNDKVKSDKIINEYERKGISRSAATTIDAKDREIKSLEAKTKKLEKEKISLTEKLNAMEVESFSVAESKIALEKSYEESKSLLVQQLDQSKSEATKLQSRLLSAESERQQLHLDYEVKFRELELYYDQRYRVTETRDSLARLQADYDRLNGDHQSLNRQHQQLHADYLLRAGKHEQSLTDNRTETHSLTVRLSEQKSLADSLSLRLQQCELEKEKVVLESINIGKKNDFLQNEIDYWKKKFADNEAHHHSVSEKLSQEEKEFYQLKSDHENVQFQLSTIKAEWERSVEANHRLTIELNEREILVHQLQEAVSTAQCELTAYEQSELRRRSDAHTSQSQSLVTDQKLTESERIIERQSLALASLKGEMTSLYAKLTALRSEKDSLCQMMKLVDENLIKIQAELTTMINEKAANLAVIDRLTKDVDQCKNELKSKDNQLLANEDSLRQKARIIFESDGKLELLSNELVLQRDATALLQQSIDQREAKIDWYDGELARAHAKESELNQKLFEAEKKARELTFTASESDRKIELLRQDKQMSEDKILSLENQLRDLGTLIGQMDSMNSDRDSEMKLSLSEIHQLKHSIFSKNENEISLKNELYDTRQRIHALESVLRDAELVRNELVNSYQAVNENNQTLTSRIAVLTGHVDDLKSDLTLLDNDRAQLVVDKQMLESELTTIKGRMTSSDLSHHSLQSELEAALKDVKLLLSENQMLTSKLRELDDGRQDALHGSQQLKIQLAMIENDCANLEARLADAIDSRRAASLETDRLTLTIQDNESLITKLRADSISKEQQLTHATLEIQRLEQSKLAAHSEAEAWRKQNEEMGNYLTKLKADIQLAAEDQANTRHQVTVLKHLMESTEAGRLMAQRQSAHFSQALSVATEDSQRKEQLKHAMAAEVTAMKDKVTGLELIIAQHRRDAANSQREANQKLESATKAVEELVQSCEQHRRTELELKSKLDDLTLQRDRLMTLIAQDSGGSGSDAIHSLSEQIKSLQSDKAKLTANCIRYEQQLMRLEGAMKKSSVSVSAVMTPKNR